MDSREDVVKISIVVPICNVEKYLEECLRSIINQSLKEIEIICVDDGSKDDSLKIINDFAAVDTRIRIIAKENSGYGDSVNRGIDEARGIYIGIVESDDFISRKMYSTLWEMTDGGTVDVVKANFWDYYDWDNEDAQAVVNDERRNLPDVKKSFILREYPDILWGHPSVWSGIYRRDFLNSNKIRFMREPGGGWVDNPFFFETLCVAKSIKWTKEPLYYYRKTNMNSSSNNQSDLTLPLRRMMDNFDVLEKYSFNDERILNFAYARALMYLIGLREEGHYYKQIDTIRPYAQKLMRRFNSRIIYNNFHIWDQLNYTQYLSPLKLMAPDSGKILIYNWIPFDNPHRIGGGVTVYCYNLINTLIAQRPDIKIYFLSSGWAYDGNETKCYIRKTENVFGDRCRSFEVVNSPVPAAQNLLLNNPKIALENQELKNVISQFLNDYGTFSVIHWNNLEGLSLDVFELKSELPNTKFIYSIHNYIPFCITGFYFQRHEQCNCNPSHTSGECLKCTNVYRRKDLSKEIYRRVDFKGDPVKEKKWKYKFGFDQLDELGDTENLLLFCEIATNNLNKYMDKILAVSKRVYDIAVDNGIDNEKLMVSYIGTAIAENQVKQSTAPESQFFKIAYLGSDINFAEKGYPFLIKALSQIDSEDAAQIDLVLTTTNGEPEMLMKQLDRFHSVEVKVGYTHRELEDILKGSDLGVIPVLWEDNLPQIAIEMVSLGIPVLSSDAGGASELCDSNLFQFKQGDVDSFKEKLLYLVKNKNVVKEYWKYHKGLTTMSMHWKELEGIMGLSSDKQINIKLDEYALLVQENEFLYRNIYKELESGAAYEREMEVRRIESEINRITNSLSYKIGYSITYIPRRIRRLCQKYIRCKNRLV